MRLKISEKIPPLRGQGGDIENSEPGYIRLKDLQASVPPRDCFPPVLGVAMTGI